MRTTTLTALAFVAMGFIFTSTAFGQSAPTVTTEADCADGTDNDSDGQIDCMDSDCAGKGSCPLLPPSGPAAPAPASSAPAASGPAAPAPAGSSSGTTTTVTGAGTVTTTVTASDHKKAFAERWHATVAPDGTISCAVPSTNSHGGGQVCWSPGFETGKDWDWKAAPMRWSQSWGEYVSKGVFSSIERANQVVGLRQQLDEMKARLDAAPWTDEVQAARDDIARARADLDAAVTTVNTSLDPIISQIRGLETQVTLILDRLDKVEGRLTDVEGRLDLVEASDAAQNAEISEMPRPGLAVEAGLQASAGNPVTNGEEGDDLAYRRIPYGIGLAVAGTFSTCSAEASCFLLQAGFVFSPSDAGGTGLGIYSNVGGEFRVAHGVSVGPLVGYQWRAHGLRNGGESAQSSEAAFGLFLRAALPMGIATAVPGVTLAVQGLAGASRHDPDGHGNFTPEPSGGILVRAAFSLGTPLRVSRVGKAPPSTP